MKRIKKLPEAIRNSIRSGAILYDLTRVVEELVYNSLDAGANKVSIAVGVGTCYVQVSDNGSGISRDGLELLGERYATSKYDPLDDTDPVPSYFGYRGEALSSITDVSLVEIVTKAHGRPNGYRKVLKGCKCLYLGINDDRKDVGTTVTVRDLFYNQPVRRKHMISNPKKVVQVVKECVLRIALVHPYISFKVVDIESEDELLHTCPFPSALPLLAKVFGTEASSSLEELNVADGGFTITGYISGTHDINSWKAFQCVYINSRFVCKGPIHKMLNNLAASFNMGSQNEKLNRSQICPSFILNLKCPKSCYDLTFEPSKTSVEFKDWDSVLSFIGNAVGNLWGRGKPADLPVKCEVGKKRRRTLDCQVSQKAPPQSKLYASRENLSSSEKFQVTVSDKLNTDCRFVSETDHPDQASDRSPPYCRVVKGHECSSDLSPLPHNLFPSEDNFLDNGLFCLNRSNKRVNNIFSSGWESACASPKIGAGTDRLLTNHLKLNTSHELNDYSDVNEDVGKPFLQSCFLRRGMKPGGTSLAVGEGFEFEIDDCSNQSAFRGDDRAVEEVNKLNDYSDVNEDAGKPFLQSCFLCRGMKPGGTSLAVDEGFEFEIDDYSNQNAFRGDDRAVEEVNNSDEILSPRNLWHNERPDVPRFTRSDKQHDVQKQLSFLHGDLLSSSLSTNISYEEGFFLPDTIEPFQRYGSCLQSGSSLLSPVRSNNLARITPKSTAHTIGEDLGTNYFEYDGSVRYDYQAYKETNGWRYDPDKISIDPGNECFFSSSKKLSSDVKVLAGFKEHSSEFREYDLKDPFFPIENNTDFLDHGMKDAFRTNTWDRGGVTDCFSSRQHTSSIDFDWDSSVRVHPRSLSKTFDPYRRRGRRSDSAPPFYRGRKKFLALSDSSTAAEEKNNVQTIHDCQSFPGTNNLKQKQQHSEINSVKPSLQSYHYDKSTMLYSEENAFSDDIPDMRIVKFDKGKCSNECHMSSFEDTIPKEIHDLTDTGEKWQTSRSHRASGSRSLHPKNQDTILDIASGILHLAGDSLVPRSMDKNCLKDARVLQQVDKKFIPTVAGRTLALIDQHAADERIRLEELRQKVLSGEMRRTNYLDCEQELVMPEIGFQLLHDYAEQIQNWGWICNVHSQGSKSFARNLNVMHKQKTLATLLAVPCVLGVNLSDVDLLEFLQQLADTDGSSTIPPSVLRVLNNKACRGAIMFGDTLLPSECSLVVEELKQTSLCFQCAHGRPTTVPLVNLDALREQIAKITSWNSASSEPWHGLNRHEISLERTTQRLNTALGN